MLWRASAGGVTSSQLSVVSYGAEKGVSMSDQAGSASLCQLPGEHLLELDVGHRVPPSSARTRSRA